MKRTLTFFMACAIATSSTVQAQQYRKGLSLESIMPKDVKIYDPEEFGFSGDLPSSYSLKEYAPYPQNQGEYSTCVGWAFGYASMSIMYAQKFNIKNRNYITAAAMCPYTVYNDCKDQGDASCQEGTYLHLAADLLKKKGTKRLYLDENGCSKSSTKDPIYRVFKVESYAALWDMRLDKDAVDSIKIEKAKTALSSGQPIVIAFRTTYSFCTTGVDSSGLWDKTKGWLYPTGGHAMAVIGYDDEKFGGAFEIQNSWGADWGNDGYVWVKYDDFAEYVYGAYVMELSDNIKSATAASANCQLGNCQEGYCRYTFETGDVYEGEIKNKKFEGNGIYQWANGDVYAGTYVNGLKQGKGIYFFADGTMKKGYWAADTLNEGMDYLEYTYGSVVSGETEFEGYQKADKWLFGDLRKETTYSTETYSGTFAENKKNGFGLTRNSWDMVYIGLVENDRFTNHFAMISSKNEYAKIFTGKNYDWKKVESDAKLAASLKIFEEPLADSLASNDKTKCTYGDCMNGYGTHKYASGNTYSGYFVNGYRQGYGVYTFVKDGKTVTYEGVYDSNEKSGVGKVTWNDSTFFVGEFFYGGLQGLGLYVTGDDKAVSGMWDAGEFVKWESEFGFGDAVTDKDKQGSASDTGRNSKYRTQKQNHSQIE